MKSAAAAIFHPNGRIRGSYVYMLMCQNSDGIHIKVGLSNDPLKRLASLMTACPIPPGILATAELPNRKKALNFEQELHCILAPWRGVGEWFLFDESDKAEFNASIQRAAAHFSSASWPIRWQKHSVPALIAIGRQRRSGFRWARRQKGRAYADFSRDSR
jgi:Meiotically Up-regulated Gene 113 (MUG113) protein